MRSPEPTSPAQRWWGELQISAHSMGRWRVGPLELWAQRLENEWRIAWQSCAEHLHRQVDVARDLAVDPPPATMTVTRFSCRGAGKPVHLVPALADRSVVVRPEVPFFIPSGEAVTLFVSTPIWVRIFLGNDSEPLLEIPTLRPSDTWFGPDTRVGELCYAGRTLAHTREDEVERRPHRAITPVHIRNHAPNALAIERLRVPVPLLMLGADARHQFWTQALTLERRTHSDDASLQLGALALPGTAIVERISGPRQVEGERSVRRALSRFFG